MSATPKNGGPAFPIIVPTETAEEHMGMSLRDYFAGQALTGLLTAKQLQFQVTSHETAAIIAYELADAMLKVRSQPPS